MIKETLKEMSELNGASGFEHEISNYVIEELKRLNIDNYFLDTMGNLYIKVEGTNADSPIVLLDAHMDEPSFMVKYIDDEGYIYVVQTGLFSPNILLGQRVRIQTKEGTVKGCFGIKSYHISEGSTTPILDDMWIDVGAKSKKDVLKLGIKPGFPVLFDEPFVELANGFVMGKAFDNRTGCTVLLEVIRELAQNRAESTVYLTFSVQEELMLRGANVIFNGIKKFFGKIPDFCIAYDICLGGDTPQVKKNKAPIELGKGAGIKVLDRSRASAHFINIVPRKVIDYFLQLCEKENIPFQNDFLSGTTNANMFAIEDIGVLTGGLSIPCRYTHSPVEIVCLNDLKNVIDLSISAVRNMHLLMDHYE
ncbi:MAG: M20/M25/M40 family metallo-hydrolase [Clostridia bacterium]|nr:M20/M25/M40 family metallo-hydrolase [Clostridia bacterium]